LGKHAALLLATLIRNLTTPDTPRLVSESKPNKKFEHMWHAAGLFSPAPKKEKLVSAGEIGSSCYTFETTNPLGNTKKCSRCNRLAHNPVLLLCGHQICTNCKENHGTRCATLEEHLANRMKDIISKIEAIITGSRAWTKANLNQDIYKLIESQPQEKSDNDEEEEDERVLDPPDISDILRKIPKKEHMQGNENHQHTN